MGCHAPVAGQPRVTTPRHFASGTMTIRRNALHAAKDGHNSPRVEQQHKNEEQQEEHEVVQQKLHEQRAKLRLTRVATAGTAGTTGSATQGGRRKRNRTRSRRRWSWQRGIMRRRSSRSRITRRDWRRNWMWRYTHDHLMVHATGTSTIFLPRPPP